MCLYRLNDVNSRWSIHSSIDSISLKSFVKRALEASQAMNSYTEEQKQKRGALWYASKPGERDIKEGKLPTAVREEWLKEHIEELSKPSQVSPK